MVNGQLRKKNRTFSMDIAREICTDSFFHCKQWTSTRPTNSCGIGCRVLSQVKSQKLKIESRESKKSAMLLTSLTSFFFKNFIPRYVEDIKLFICFAKVLKKFAAIGQRCIKTRKQN